MPDIAFVIIAVALLLLLVAVLQPLAGRLSLPHTVLLAVFGLAIGGVVVAGQAASPEGLGADLLRALDRVELPSDALTHIFLPTLLFQVALALNVRRLLDDFWAIFVLAVVAVVVTTLAIGFGMAAVSGLALAVCMLLGAIVATTDPSAVVGLFRDVGAPRRLGILIEGESLLNDAAAIALYVIFLTLTINLGETDWLRVGAEFCVDLVGGLAVGIGSAWAACLILPRLYGLRLAETTVTLALAYIAYAVADSVVGVSGVVSVVSAGLFMGSFGRTRVAPESWSVLVDVWQQLGYWASGLVFLLAAMAMPRLLSAVGWTEIGLLAVMLVAAFAARAGVLAVFFPIIARFRLGRRLSRGYMVAIWWGGVRGALTLALALAVTEHPDLQDDPIGPLVATLATGFVLFTLFVNATTLPWVIQLMGLDRLSPADRVVRVRALGLALDKVKRDLRATARRYDVEPEITGAVSEKVDARRDGVDGDGEAAADLSLDDRLYIGLTALAAQERQIYEDLFAQRIVSRHTNRALLAFSGRLADAVKTHRLDGYKAVSWRPMRFAPATRIAVWFNRRLHVQRLLSRVLADRYETLLTMQVAVRDLIAFSSDRLLALIGEEAAAVLDRTLTERLQRIATGLQALELQYPDYTKALKMLQMTRIAMRFEDAAYRALFDSAMISQEVHNTLMKDWRVRWNRSERRPRLDVSAPVETLVRRVPMFEALEPGERSALAKLLRARLFMPGERIMSRGERGEAMFFLLSGAVEVTAAGGTTRLGSGELFGEIALVFNRPRTADVTALGYCEVLMLRRSDFSAFLNAHPKLRAEVVEVAQRRLTETRAAEDAPA